MKRSEIQRKAPLKRGSGPKRTTMKRSQPRRNWQAAREKVESEGMCRACGACLPPELLHAAHVVGREHDFAYPGGRTGLNPAGLPADALYVHPDRVVPLCAGDHRRYDPHTRGLDEQPVDLLPHLTADEKRQALEDCDMDVFAFLHRTTGCRWAAEKGAA